MNELSRVWHDGRQMIIVAIFLAVASITFDSLRATWEETMLERPWLHPTIKIVAPGLRGEKPQIRYGANSEVDLTGEWKAWLEISGIRCCTAGGQGVYHPDKQPKTWEWADFFGRDWPVPQKPFSACVKYSVETVHGAKGVFGPFCSVEVDPAEWTDERPKVDGVTK